MILEKDEVPKNFILFVCFLEWLVINQSVIVLIFLPDCSIFQKSVTAPREADDTVWAYLPRTPRL